LGPTALTSDPDARPFDSNGDSNVGGRSLPPTHRSIPPRLGLIIPTGDPLRLKNGRSGSAPSRHDCCQYCCHAAGQRRTCADHSGMSAQRTDHDGPSWTMRPLLRIRRSWPPRAMKWSARPDTTPAHNERMSAAQQPRRQPRRRCSVGSRTSGAAGADEGPATRRLASARIKIYR
jgi:hypothetical protein